MPEARLELEQMMEDAELRDAVFLVLANKQDLPGAASAAEVIEQLGLATRKGPAHKWHVQGCCALRKEGIHEGFAWLAETLKNQHAK